MGELVAAAAVGFVGNEVLKRVLGPTLDYVGEGLRALAEKRRENVGRVIQNAATKTPDEAANNPVPAILLRDLLDSASLKEDQFAVEYFGGILASSKTGISRDDRAAKLSATLNRLSAYDINLHYILYYCFHRELKGTDIKLTTNQGRGLARLLLPPAVYLTPMQFAEAEALQYEAILSGALFSLVREDLIGHAFAVGSVTDLRNQGVLAATEDGSLLVEPTVLGAELFLAAHGLRGVSSDRLFARDTPLRPLANLSIPVGSKRP